MDALRLIASGAYVDQELSAEFGRIPPAFLPIGVSRLYEAQLSNFGRSRIYMTIPQDFVPPAYDLCRLSDLNVTLLPVPPGLSLGESISFAIKAIDHDSNAMQLLLGDTLIEPIIEDAADCVAVHSEGDDYTWATVELDERRDGAIRSIETRVGHDGSRPVVCGYFAFEDRRRLVEAIARSGGDFIAGLNLYNLERPLRTGWVGRWHDFGHLQTYFRSRRALFETRSFNTISVHGETVRKSSLDAHKIRAEANWYAAMPASLKPYTARLLNVGADHYDIQYHYSPTLAELMVFSSIGRSTWRRILRCCVDFMEACAAVRGPAPERDTIVELAVAKTLSRLDWFARTSGFDPEAPTRIDGRPMPSLLRIVEELASMLRGISPRPATIMHGDLCFGNIIYDSRAGRIVVIDPRGFVASDSPSIFGDLRYDLAKLSHSVVGGYDHIIAGRYDLQRPASHDLSIAFEATPQQAWLQAALSEIEVDGVRIGSEPVQAVMITLFLSMLPLHFDRPNRQVAFIANALRLFAALQAGRLAV